MRIQRVFPDLTFAGMTGMYQDAEGNWYVTEQIGRIQRIDGDTGEASMWLDLTDRVNAEGFEMGLLGFAFAPDFEGSHTFYVDYTGEGGVSFVSRFAAHDGHEVGDPSSEQVLLRVEQPFPNHNGGQIAFGPDGYLYIAFGDGGSRNDPEENAQDFDVLLGKILRIDVSGNGEYSVPDDNPFVGQDGARPEIWALGFRNPWRFSFDSETGDLWAGDVGQFTSEEVDLVAGGGNYGWNVMEGFRCRGNGRNCIRTGLLEPVFEYATGSGGTCAITGGFVYRGTAIPELRGAYVFSDYCSGVIYALRATPEGILTEQTQLARTGLNVSSLAQDNEGELYVLDRNGGGIYKLGP